MKSHMLAGSGTGAMGNPPAKEVTEVTPSGKVIHILPEMFAELDQMDVALNAINTLTGSPDEMSNGI
jgi:hypothetical protein